MSDLIGKTIGHYTIIDEVGRGGMGIVYKAQDTKLKRAVALKFLPQNLAASDQDRVRFMQEAEAASALNHPNVCTIHDIETRDGQTFIVMEFVEGQTLRRKKDSLSLKQALDIGIQIAEGLSAAHEKGIVHRDIKPDNIMVRKDGIVQIMDFGLAKLRGVSNLTKEGSTVGTVGYMSPEQVQGMDTDHRSDIFSLGVVLYEMCAGQLPFKGVHETAMAYEIVNVDPLPMSAVKPEIDPALDAVVLECLAKDPAERYQSMAEVAKDLRRYKRESSRERVSRVMAARPLMSEERPVSSAGLSPGTSARKRTAPVLPWMISGVLALAAVIAFWSPWKSSREPRPVIRFTIPTPKDQVLTLTSYNALAISPDGSRLVFRAGGKLWIRKMNDLSSTPIQGTDDASSPFFSPDGRWLAFFSGGKLKKTPLEGGSSITLADAPDNRGGTWNRAGMIVFGATAIGGLREVSDAGGDVKQVTSIDTARNERSHRWPHFLPDGTTVLYTMGVTDSPDFYEDATIEAVDLKTGVQKVVLKGASTACYIAPGYLTYSRNGVLFAVRFDPDRLEPKGTAFPVVENLNGDPTTGAMDYAIAENGTLAFVSGEINASGRSLMMLDQEGAATPIPAPPEAYMEPRISPDGKRLAVVVQAGKDYDIWIYDLARGTMSRLTFGGDNRSPAWSPDGKRIAYYSPTEEKTAVLIRNADGSGTAEVVATGLGRSYVDCWSHDGMLLILNRTSQKTLFNNSDITVLPLTGDRKPWDFLSTSFDEWQSSLSPDGKWIAYVSNETGKYEIYIQPFPHGGSKWQVSLDEAYEPHWAPDGRTLYFRSPDRLNAVPVETSPSLVVGKPRVVVTGYNPLNLDSGITYDLMPDGHHFVVTRASGQDESLKEMVVVLNWFEDIVQKTARN